MMGATNGIASFEGDGCNKNISSKVNAVIDMDGLLAFIHSESVKGMIVKEHPLLPTGLGIQKLKTRNYGNKAHR
jgi:hypothetical protein